MVMGTRRDCHDPESVTGRLPVCREDTKRHRCEHDRQHRSHSERGRARRIRTHEKRDRETKKEAETNREEYANGMVHTLLFSPNLKVVTAECDTSVEGPAL